MPVPEGIISTSEVWTQPTEEVVELPTEEECACFYGASCPSDGKHKE